MNTRRHCQHKYVGTFAMKNSIIALHTYFVSVQMLLVGEMCCGCEQMHKPTLHAFVEDALSYQLAHKVLPGARPAM